MGRILIPISCVCRYLVITSDVLTSVKKMEESLRRLRTARGTSSAGGSQGMTDDDKIRLQLCLDVKELSTQVNWLAAANAFSVIRVQVICNGQLFLCWCFWASGKKADVFSLSVRSLRSVMACVLVARDDSTLLTRALKWILRTTLAVSFPVLSTTALDCCPVEISSSIHSSCHAELAPN